MPNWIEKNKKQITRQNVTLDKEKAQDIYNALKTDNAFSLPSDLVCKELGLDKEPRPQTLQKWLLNSITLTDDYTLKIGHSAQGCFIFRRIGDPKTEENVEDDK